MANSFSPPRRNAMAPVQPVANVPMAVAPLYSAPTPQDAEVLKRFLLGAGKAALAGVQFPGDLMHDAARSLRAGRPAGVYADLVETARRVSRDPAAVPGMVVNALKSQAEQARSSPGAMAETMGGMLDVRNMLRRKPTMAELDVYHGTPHTFEPETGAPLGRFRSSKIGTGEGAQAYGYGLYFAEDSNVAGSYKTTLSTRDKNRITLDGQRIDPDTMFGRSLEDLKKLGRQSALQKLDDNIRFNEKYAPDMAELYRSVRNKIDTIDESKVSVKEGSLYKVDLPDAKIEQMLDWDKPLSEQPKAFEIAKNVFNDPRRKQAGFPSLSDAEIGNLSGSDLYQAMTPTWRGGQKGASSDLRQLGIPGIKYLDAGSRAGEKGTRNFVVFPGEEQNLTILKRD